MHLHKIDKGRFTRNNFIVSYNQVLCRATQIHRTAFILVVQLELGPATQFLVISCKHHFNDKVTNLVAAFRLFRLEIHIENTVLFIILYF
jgi:hypothetical protein